MRQDQARTNHSLLEVISNLQDENKELKDKILSMQVKKEIEEEKGSGAEGQFVGGTDLQSGEQT